MQLRLRPLRYCWTAPGQFCQILQRHGRENRHENESIMKTSANLVHTDTLVRTFDDGNCRIY